MMRYRLVTTRELWDAWRVHLAATHRERMAFGYCGLAQAHATRDYLLRSVDIPRDAEYRYSEMAAVSLTAAHVIPRVLAAKGSNAFVDVHSHPFAEQPAPSPIDDEGAKKQRGTLAFFAPGVDLVRIVVSGTGAIWAEVAPFGEADWCPVEEIIIFGETGRRIVRPVNTTRPDLGTSCPAHLRTAAVLGPEGMHGVRSMRVLVIGCGGVGSAVIAQLRGYVDWIGLVDPDLVEGHNAPRLYQFAARDVGRPKIRIMRRDILRGSPRARVRAVQASFPSQDTLELLREADVVFICPDNNAARYAAAEQCARFMKPLIEVGCGGIRRNGQVTALGYHVRLQIPGQVCLACSGLSTTSLEDPASSAMKREAGYVTEGDLIQGELMPLTSRAASDAVDMFFRLVTGYAGALPRHIYFDALTWRTLDLTEAYERQAECPICGTGSDSRFGAGETLSSDQQVLPCPSGGECHAAA